MQGEEHPIQGFPHIHLDHVRPVGKSVAVGPQRIFGGQIMRAPMRRDQWRLGPHIGCPSLGPSRGLRKLIAAVVRMRDAGPRGVGLRQSVLTGAQARVTAATLASDQDHQHSQDSQTRRFHTAQAPVERRAA